MASALKMCGDGPLWLILNQNYVDMMDPSIIKDYIAFFVFRYCNALLWVKTFIIVKEIKKKKSIAFHMKSRNMKQLIHVVLCVVRCLPNYNYTKKTLGVFYESHNATMQGYIKRGDTPIRVKLKP
jgi:hypothetical protein